MLAFSTLLLFWTAADLENKLLDFRTYFNNQRTLNGRANAESACVTTNRKSSLVSMATSLSIRIIRHPWLRDFRRLSIAPVSGQPWENFQLNHLVTAFSRFADPIVSLQRYQFAGDRIAG